MPDILIVDDDPLTGEAIESILLQAGFSCTYCSSPLEALQALQKETYQILVTDMNMPQVTGLELLIWAKKRQPHLQALMMTGYPIDTIQNLALAGGALKILAKPCSAQELLRQIRLCLQPGMASNIDRIQLSDLLQVLALDQHGRLLEIHDAEQDVTVRLGVEHQILCYAEWISRDAHLTGYPACLKALTLTRGTFSEKSLQDVVHNLQYPLQDALLTVATQQDESQPNQAHGMQIHGLFEHILCYSPSAQAVMVPIKILQNQHFSVEHVTELKPESLTPEKSVLFHLSRQAELAKLEALCAQFPSTPFVVLEDGIQSYHLTAPNLLKRFSAPWSLREVRDFLQPYHQQGLGGHLSNLGLLSQLQLFLMSRKPKRLSIKNLSAKTSGTLYLANHRILEAQAGHETGEKAFFTLTQTMRGLVMEADWQEPPSRSLADTAPVRLFMQATTDHSHLGDMQMFIIEKIESLLCG